MPSSAQCRKYAPSASSFRGLGALVQQSNSVESLSSIDILCIDKTGILTANQLMFNEAIALGDGLLRSIARFVFPAAIVTMLVAVAIYVTDYHFLLASPLSQGQEQWANQILLWISGDAVADHHSDRRRGRGLVFHHAYCLATAPVRALFRGVHATRARGRITAVPHPEPLLYRERGLGMRPLLCLSGGSAAGTPLHRSELRFRTHRRRRRHCCSR